MVETTTNQASEMKKQQQNLRTEIDTSAPFESVKEAVNRFGGVGYWKPIHHQNACVLTDSQHHVEELDSKKLEELAAVLEKELTLKERETLDVLKELESTKGLVEELKSKLQKEELEANMNLQMRECCQRSTVDANEDKENKASQLDVLQPSKGSFVCNPSSTPGLILMELKQAKLNITRTTNDLADVRASIQSLTKKLEKERTSLEKTCERLSHNSSKITSLEQELHQTRLKLKAAKDAEIKRASDDPSYITRELHQLSSEAEHFKKIGESAKSELLRTMSEIEKTKTMIRTAEIRLVAARKMKEAARAVEAAALADTNALSTQESSSPKEGTQKHDGITLSLEEYTALTCQARDAEEQSKKKVESAMLEVEAAHVSRTDVLERLEEATEEVKTSKKALEESLKRVEAANTDKLAVEEALRNWRSEGQRRSSSIKFKNSYPSHRRRDSRSLDLNGTNMVNDEIKPVLKPTLSIGQILSRKLFLSQESEAGISAESIPMKHVSLGQMLGKQSDDPLFNAQVEKQNGQKQFSVKKKKFGFAGFSSLLSKQQKKKKPTLNLS